MSAVPLNELRRAADSCRQLAEDYLIRIDEMVDADEPPAATMESLREAKLYFRRVHQVAEMVKTIEGDELHPEQGVPEDMRKVAMNFERVASGFTTYFGLDDPAEPEAVVPELPAALLDTSAGRLAEEVALVFRSAARAIRESL